MTMEARIDGRRSAGVWSAAPGPKEIRLDAPLIDLLLAAAILGFFIWRFRVRGSRRAPPLQPASLEPMSLAQARAILGVGPAATAADIREAYTRLMRRAHPDHGGTSGLAAQLNAARDRLRARAVRRLSCPARR